MTEVKDAKPVTPTTSKDAGMMSKLGTQFGALMRKNYLVQKRNVGATSTSTLYVKVPINIFSFPW